MLRGRIVGLLHPDRPQKGDPKGDPKGGPKGGPERGTVSVHGARQLVFLSCNEWHHYSYTAKALRVLVLWQTGLAYDVDYVDSGSSIMNYDAYVLSKLLLSL